MSYWATFSNCTKTVASMGIDIGFTDKSLMQSKYALCRPFRSRFVGFHYEIPKEGVDELAQYRERRKVINLAHLQTEEPGLYERLTKDEPPIFRRDTLYWHKDLPERYALSSTDSRRLRKYVESQPSSRVRFRGMPRELADEWRQKADGALINAWWDIPYDKQIETCKPCPIRPMDETNCYIRFSNYPGMNGFRHGFALTLLYSAGIDEEKLKRDYFAFPHLNREAGELPKHKIGELFEMCKDSPVNKGAEVMFNSVVDMLEQIKPPDAISDMSKINMDSMPFIDQFISTYIYREKPYGIEDTRKVIPYLETMLEVADWAIWDTNDDKLRRPVIAFRNRFQSLVTALKIAEKYDLEVSMRY